MLLDEVLSKYGEELNFVVSLDVPDEVILERIEGQPPFSNLLPVHAHCWSLQTAGSTHPVVVCTTSVRTFKPIRLLSARS